MRAVRAGLQLRVRLRADEPGMLRQLDHLYDAAVRGLTGQKHAVLLKNLAVIVVDFIAVTMALVDDFLAVELIGLRGFIQYTGIGAKTQGAADIGDAVLSGIKWMTG